MDTRQLKCFLKIVDTGSISRAAISLSISQPSLSQQLLRLEDELGVQLFHRGARGVTVTEAGRIFVEHARMMLHSNEQILESLRSLKASASGGVVLAGPRSVIQRIGVSLFETAWRAAPDISLRIGEAPTIHITSWLEDGKIDLALLYDLAIWPNLTFRPLASEELFLIGAPGAFEANRAESLPLRDLKNFPLILPGLPHALRQLLDREAARLGFSLNIVHEVEVLEMIAELISRGHGHAILPWPLICAAVGAGNLDCQKIGGGALRRTLFLARNSTRTLTHASMVAEDLIMEILHGVIASGVWEAQALEGLGSFPHKANG